MPRVNVWVPDELYTEAGRRLPGLNYSAALQAAIRERLKCFHHRLACAACAVEIDHLDLIGEWLYKFAGDYLARLEPLVQAAGTAEGAARILRDHIESWQATGVMSRDYRRQPLPRPSRAARATATPGRREQAMPPTGIKDWALHPAARRRAAANRNRARAAARRRSQERA